MVHFNKPQYRTVATKKKDIPKGVWVKCPLSGEIVFCKDLEANQMVVPKSGYHFRIGSRERLKNLIDPGTFQEFGMEVRAADPLLFVELAGNDGGGIFQKLGIGLEGFGIQTGLFVVMGQVIPGSTRIDLVGKPVQ